MYVLTKAFIPQYNNNTAKPTSIIPTQTHSIQYFTNLYQMMPALPTIML